MNIADYHIEMLDVGAADAFIIHLVEQNGGTHLILVDSGNYSDGNRLVDHLWKFYDEPCIDLAIVTHCDKDHYGGFVRMLEKEKNGDDDFIPILNFWVNDPSMHGVEADDVEWKRTQKSVDEHLKSVYTVNDINLLDLIDELEIPRYEKFSQVDFLDYTPFAKKDSNYDCITIIGPTKKFYESRILEMRNKLNAIVEANENGNFSLDEAADGLDDAADDKSAHNQTSIIFTLELNGKKYLFTGDASEESFNNVWYTHKPLLKNAYWLKVPHHGSNHNLTTAWMNYMNPWVAYISTEREDHYLSQATVDALNKVGCRVYSTHVHGDMLHHAKRIGYIKATPLQ